MPTPADGGPLPSGSCVPTVRFRPQGPPASRLQATPQE